MLLLPLRHRGKTHSRILGSFAPAGFPHWLGLVPVARLSLVSIRMILASETRRGEAVAGRLPFGRAGDAAAGVPASRRAAFAVVQGGRSGPPQPRGDARITLV